MGLRVFDNVSQTRKTGRDSNKQEMGVMQNYDLGRVFSRLFQMVTRCFLPASGFIAVCIIAMLAVLALAFGSLFTAMLGSIGASPTDQAEAMQQAMMSLMAGGVGIVMLIIGLIGALFISSVMIAGLVDACLRSARGETPSFSSCFAAGMSNCLKLTGFMFLWQLLLVVVIGVIAGSLGYFVSGWLGGLVGVILFTILTALFSPAIPALVNEPETGAIGAFSRGSSLASGHLGMIVLTLILWTLMYGAFSFIVSLVLGLFGGLLGAISSYLMVLMIVPYLAFYVVIYLFMYGTMATIYSELKMIKEGGDGQNMADVFS